MTAVASRRGVATIVLDNPPVNALSFRYCEGLLEELARAERDRDVRTIVFRGANGLFSAGADVNDFASELPSGAKTVRDVIEAVECSEKVFVAAIDGNAMGGATELALACDYRFATPRSRMGLPEIKLGLLPGAGGTQRLPRLIGAQDALQLMLKGDIIAASEAKAKGLIDDVVDDLAGIEERATRKRRVSAMPVRIAHGMQAFALPFVIAQAHKMVPPEDRGGFAAHKVIDAVQAAFELPFPRGLAREYRLFDELVRSAPSQALRHLFFAERELSKVPGLESVDRAELPAIAKAGIIGGGTMGTGIAITFANAGIPAVVVEPDARQVEKARQMVFGMFMHQVKRGRLTQEEAWKRGQSIAFHDDYQPLAECDVVIEAVFERMDVKKAVFAKVDPLLKPGAILASNTSTLDIDEMANVTSCPERFLGLHFFAPANIMKLLEIVRGERTSARTLAAAFKLGKTLRKVSVLSANAFGFIGNRMIVDYTREAIQLAEEGVPPYRIDDAMKAFGMAMGPFAMFDLSGIDVFRYIQQARPDLANARTGIIDRLYEQNRLGQKTGRGFYRYAEGSREPQRDEEVEAMIASESAAAGIARRDGVTDAEIVQRLTGALSVAGDRLLREKVALRPGDIDIVYVYGYGFPPHLGGPMWYARA